MFRSRKPSARASSPPPSSSSSSKETLKCTESAKFEETSPLLQPTSTEPFRAPDTWDGHRSIRPAFCQCADQATTMDPLCAAASHNLTCSPLCRLPEEVLLKIMAYADPLTMQCLRRTCRVFLRLYCSSEFAYSHATKVFKNIGMICTHWHQPSDLYWTKNMCPKLVSRLQRDLEEYCDACRATRTSPKWAEKVQRLTIRRLYCSGCKAYHPRVMFSAAQRWKPVGRICIGRAGHIRLCEHKVIRWQDISLAARQLGAVHGSFRPSITLFRCHDESHRPSHHHPNTAAVAGCQNTAPCFGVQATPDHNWNLYLQWQGHWVVDDPGERPASPNSLRQQLHRFREGVAEFIAPEMAPGRLPEMNSFDPNRCRCLLYESMEEVRGGWHSPAPEALKVRNCRLDRQYELGALQPGISTDDWEDVGPSKGKPDAEGELWIGGHFAKVQTTGTFNWGTSILEIHIDPCVSRDARCLSVDYKRTIGLSFNATKNRPWPDHVPQSWCQALDPDSYNLTQDQESLGVTWCREPGCRNYYRYLRELVAPLSETTPGAKPLPPEPKDWSLGSMALMACGMYVLFFFIVMGCLYAFGG